MIADTFDGIAPDAIDNLKRAFKGLFKRGKKSSSSSKTSTATDANSTSTPTGVSQPPPQSATPSTAGPPQLPPIQNASPLTSATDTSKPLPPTHPLATGQHEEPEQAVPVNEEAKPGPPAPIVGPAESPEQVKEQQQQQSAISPVSLPQPGSAVDGTSGDVSAVTNETSTPASRQPSQQVSPQEGVKTDSAAESGQVEEPAGRVYHKADGSVHELTEAATTSSPAPNNENIPPNPTTSTATETNSAPDSAAPATNGEPALAPAATSKTTDVAPASPEEKVSVLQDEPPPIKTAKPAPGMSATSGPLEDFPEGGDMRDS